MITLYALRRWLLVLPCFAVACGGSATGPTPPADVPARITISPGALSVAVGSVDTLTATVYDSADSVIPNAPVTFSSNDTAVATVTASGVVTAVRAGTAAVGARSDSAFTAITVSVTPPPPTAARITISPATLSLAVGAVDTLTATVYDSTGAVIPNAPVTFSSNDTAVATVTASGIVTGVSGGTAAIAARSDTAFAAITVTVTVGAFVKRIPLGGSPFGAAMSAANIGYVTESNGNSVAQIDPYTGAVVNTIPVGAFPTSVAFNGAGTRAYVGNQLDTTVSVIDVASASVISTIAVAGNPIAELVGPGDSLLFVASNSNEVYTVRVPANVIVDSVATPDFSNAMILHGTHVWVSVPYAGEVMEFDAFTRQVLNTITTGGTTQGLAVSGDESELYLANESGQLQIWNTATGAPIAGVPLSGGGGFGLAVDPANGLLYVTASGTNGEVDIIDPTTHVEVGTINTGGIPRRVVFTSQGDLGLVANESGWVDVIR